MVANRARSSQIQLSNKEAEIQGKRNTYLTFHITLFNVIQTLYCVLESSALHFAWFYRVARNFADFVIFWRTNTKWESVS